MESRKNITDELVRFALGNFQINYKYYEKSYGDKQADYLFEFQPLLSMVFFREKVSVLIKAKIIQTIIWKNQNSMEILRTEVYNKNF